MPSPGGLEKQLIDVALSGWPHPILFLLFAFVSASFLQILPINLGLFLWKAFRPTFIVILWTFGEYLGGIWGGIGGEALKDAILHDAILH